MDLKDTERLKYEKVWADKRYREHSPGEMMVDRAVLELDMKPGQSVIDYGCGTGRAARKFASLGFEVIGIDHAINCMDPEAGIHFVRACLWDASDLHSDWAFCCDVMEHIPEEKVDDVLSLMRGNTKSGAFLQIDLGRDGFGPLLIGEPLHLTIKSAEWWRSKLAGIWASVVVEDHGSSAAFVCR